MRITDADVTYVANLANLELTDDERCRMVKDLDSILTYIDRLNELETSDVPPMAQVFAQSGVTPPDARNTGALREDSVEPCLKHQEAMQNAPNSDGQFFRVPKVIER
jgi:aspartyl-tRNA(Asn)/glutamyl-tRNA(Gln) amidotransferase subunit C